MQREKEMQRKKEMQLKLLYPMQREKEMEILPNDLMVEIFSRLPSKSVARFCTLSKHWASTFHSQEFAKLFLARSSTRPRLLFAVDQYFYRCWQIFSTLQPQNQHEKSSHVDFHTKFKADPSCQYICSYSSGLFYFPNVRMSEDDAPLIFNPITGLYVRLPSVQSSRKSRGFLGFDPVDKQFKVMSEAFPLFQFQDRYGDFHHNILTLGSQEPRWRSNNTTIYDRSLSEGICINGFLYYLARTSDLENIVIVCFDVRSEEFKFINAECFSDQLEADPIELSLVNYKGKLGGIYGERDEAGTFELCVWVLEDLEKIEWVNYVYTLPEDEVLSSSKFSVAGVTATGDIVLVMKFMCKPFYVFYFNPERNSLQSVEVQGFGSAVEVTPNRVYAFVDHVEDLSVNNAKQLKSVLPQVRCGCPCCTEKQKGSFNVSTKKSNHNIREKR